jgi:tetratricopeptide (TPR) repeat protein
LSDWYPGSGMSYGEYMLQKGFVADVVDAQREAARDAVRAMDRATLQLVAGQDALRAEQGQGLARIADELSSLGEAVDDLNASFRWGFASVLAVLGGMSESLQSLVKLAKTPAQTAAYEHFEIARDAFRRGLIEESLESLERATLGDHVSPGYKLEWRFHQLAGVIHLDRAGRAGDAGALTLAEEAFLLAARYAKVDAPREAARAMVSAGWAAFARGDLAAAQQHTEEAFKLDRLGEAFFQYGKILMAQDQPERALPHLRRAIECDPSYVLKAAGDGEYGRFADPLREFLRGMGEDGLLRLRPTLVPLVREATPWTERDREVSDDPTLEAWGRLLERGMDEGVFPILQRLHELKRDRSHVAGLLTAARERWEKRERAREESRQREDLARRQAEERDRFLMERAVLQVGELAAYLQSVGQLECLHPPYACWREDLLGRQDLREAAVLPPGTPVGEAVLLGRRALELLAPLKQQREGIISGLAGAREGLLSELPGLHELHYRGVRWANGQRVLWQLARLLGAMGVSTPTPNQEAIRRVEDWIERAGELDGILNRLAPWLASVSSWRQAREKADEMLRDLRAGMLVKVHEAVRAAQRKRRGR